MPRQIKENALFIADAHYPHHGDDFLTLLKNIENKTIETSQLFLMGDIFDLLFGHNDYIKTFSQKAIELLNQLSTKLEIIYIEGNHDFCLKEVFPNIKVYSREEQPVHFKLNNQDVCMSHGDKYQTGLGYNLYSKIIRNQTTLTTLTILTILKPFEKRIIDHRMAKLKAKNICGDFIGYKKKFDAIREHYQKDTLIIEGHFHQALIHKNYISLPSLACHHKMGVVKDGVVKFMALD